MKRDYFAYEDQQSDFDRYVTLHKYRVNEGKIKKDGVISGSTSVISLACDNPFEILIAAIVRQAALDYIGRDERQRKDATIFFTTNPYGLDQSTIEYILKKLKGEHDKWEKSMNTMENC